MSGSKSKFSKDGEIVAPKSIEAPNIGPKNLNPLDYLISHSSEVQSFPALVYQAFPHWINIESIQSRHSDASIREDELGDFEPTETLRLVANSIFTRNMNGLFATQMKGLSQQLKGLDDDVLNLRSESFSLNFSS